MSTNETPKAEASTKKSGGLLVVLVLVNLVAVLGVGAYVIVTGLSANKAHASVKTTTKGTPAHFGPLLDLEPIVANLNESSASRYIKVKVHLEVANETAKEAMTPAIPALRDRTLTILSNLTAADTVGGKQKEKLRSQLKASFNEVLGQPRVRNVYFSEFVVQ